MTTIDLLAQLILLLSGLVAIRHRDVIEDMTDGNVERLEREDRAAEAREILPLMQKVRVA